MTCIFCEAIEKKLGDGDHHKAIEAAVDRLFDEPIYTKRSVSEGGTNNDASDFYEKCQDMSDWAQEGLVVLTLNQKNKILKRHLIHLGSATYSLVHPREVLRPAVLEGAAAVCVVHNHPSGDPAPSKEDDNITERLKSACEIMGIRMLDHIIIGNSYYSYSDEGRL